MARTINRGWADVIPARARNRNRLTSRSRTLEEPERSAVIAVLEQILADGWHPMFVIMAHPKLPAFLVEMQVRCLLDELSTGPDQRFRAHQVPKSRPANYWTVQGNPRPFQPSDTVVKPHWRNRPAGDAD